MFQQERMVLPLQTLILIIHSLPIKDPLRPDILLLFYPFKAGFAYTIEFNPFVRDYDEPATNTEWRLWKSAAGTTKELAPDFLSELFYSWLPVAYPSSTVPTGFFPSVLFLIDVVI